MSRTFWFAAGMCLCGGGLGLLGYLTLSGMAAVAVIGVGVVGFVVGGAGAGVEVYDAYNALVPVPQQVNVRAMEEDPRFQAFVQDKESNKNVTADLLNDDAQEAQPQVEEEKETAREEKERERSLLENIRGLLPQDPRSTVPIELVEGERDRLKAELMRSKANGLALEQLLAAEQELNRRFRDQEEKANRPRRPWEPAAEPGEPGRGPHFLYSGHRSNSPRPGPWNQDEKSDEVDSDQEWFDREGQAIVDASDAEDRRRALADGIRRRTKSAF